MKDLRPVWRSIFDEFELGDRVQVVNQGWIYKNQIGNVVGKEFFEGRWFYLIRLPDDVMKVLGCSQHHSNNEAGWFKNEDLLYVGKKGKPGPLYKQLGTMSSHTIGVKTIWNSKGAPSIKTK